MEYTFSPEENKELQPVPLEELENNATKYEFDGKLFYLTDEGYAYNDQGEMVLDGKRRQIINEGKIINQAA